MRTTLTFQVSEMINNISHKSSIYPVLPRQRQRGADFRFPPNRQTCLLSFPSQAAAESYPTVKLGCPANSRRSDPNRSPSSLLPWRKSRTPRPWRPAALLGRVERQVECHPRHPGIQRARPGPAETADHTEDLDKGVLHQVFRFGCVPGVAATEREQAGAVRLVQFPPRRVVAPGTTPGQFLLVHYMYNCRMAVILRRK